MNEPHSHPEPLTPEEIEALREQIRIARDFDGLSRLHTEYLEELEDKAKTLNIEV